MMPVSAVVWLVERPETVVASCGWQARALVRQLADGCPKRLTGGQHRNYLFHSSSELALFLKKLFCKSNSIGKKQIKFFVELFIMFL
jgi:hypothetical protein